MAPKNPRKRKGSKKLDDVGETEFFDTDLSESQSQDTEPVKKKAGNIGKKGYGGKTSKVKAVVEETVDTVDTEDTHDTQNTDNLNTTIQGTVRKRLATFKFTDEQIIKLLDWFQTHEMGKGLPAYQLTKYKNTYE